MTDVITLLLPFFGLILAGFIAAKASKQPATNLGYMHVFTIYTALPALFFKLVSKTPIEDLTRLDFVGAAIGTTYGVFLVLFVLGRRIQKISGQESTMQAFAGAYGNIGYMGSGLALLALGERAAVPVALIVCLENAAHFVTAPVLMACFGDRRALSWRLAGDIVRKVTLHPFILSTAAGFVAASVRFDPPVAFQHFIDFLANSAAPCALFAMGATLALRPIKTVPSEVYFIVPVKLLVHPLALYAVLTAIGRFDAVWIEAAVLLAALPTATNVFVISQHYGVWQERASAVILITTALSMMTLSALLVVLKSGLLPA